MITLPETRDECLARLAREDAALLARLEATYPLCDDFPAADHPTYPIDREPTEADWADYAAWSKALLDHGAALALWMVYCDDEGKSTYYVS